MIGRAKDSSRLSTNPAQIRRRLRRKHEKFEEDLKFYVQAGFKPVEEWDFEELARGKPRNKSGNFQGRAPAWITGEIIREAKKRLLDETFGNLAQYGSDAVKTIHKLMTSEEVDDSGRPVVDARTRLAAAQFIVEHLIGKPKAVIEVEAGDFTRRALASAIVLDDGQPQDEPVVLEGEVLEEDDDGE